MSLEARAALLEGHAHRVWALLPPDGGLTAKQLRQLSGLSRRTVYRCLGELAEAGLLGVRPCFVDARQKLFMRAKPPQVMPARPVGVTRVIHVRDWDRRSRDHVYIGRAGQGQDGLFGNPVRRGDRCPRCARVHVEAASTLPCYSAILHERLGQDAAFREAVRQLAGQVLVCFCKPGPCHGDVLAAAADALAQGSEWPPLPSAAVEATASGSGLDPLDRCPGGSDPPATEGVLIRHCLPTAQLDRGAEAGGRPLEQGGNACRTTNP
jgi:hypothetical protein